MNSSTCPRPAKVRLDFFLVEHSGDFCFVFSLFHEHPIDGAYNRDFLGWSGNKDYAIRLDALFLASDQDLLGSAGLVLEQSPEAIPSGTTLPEAKLDQATLAEEYFGG